MEILNQMMAYDSERTALENQLFANAKNQMKATSVFCESIIAAAGASDEDGYYGSASITELVKNVRQAQWLLDFAESSFAGEPLEITTSRYEDYPDSYTAIWVSDKDTTVHIEAYDKDIEALGLL